MFQKKVVPLHPISNKRSNYLVKILRLWLTKFQPIVSHAVLARTSAQWELSPKAIFTALIQISALSVELAQMFAQVVLFQSNRPWFFSVEGMVFDCPFIFFEKNVT